LIFFFVKFIKAEQEFFIKIDMRIMSITPTKQTIFIHNLIFYEKILTIFKKLTKKWQKCINFFLIGTKLRLEGLKDQLLMFLNENN